MGILVVAVGALVVGFLMAYVFLNSSVKNSYEIQFQERLRKSNEKAAKEALKRSSAALKGQIGERIAPLTAGFDFEPADARFLGSPVDYVVFDGMADGNIQSITFVEVKVGALPLSPFQQQVREVIKEGNVEWQVLQLRDKLRDV